jgi:hypothetical protein
MGTCYFSEKERFWVAGGIWGIFCQQIIRGKGNSIYSKSATSSQKKSFQEEFVDLLNKYDITFDEKYIWK